MPEATTLLGYLPGLLILVEAAGAFGVWDQERIHPPHPPRVHLLAGGHRPAHPAAPSLGVARVFQALLCNQENFQLQECGLTSLSCQESTGEVRAAWAVGEAPRLAREQAAEVGVAMALDETPLLLLVLLKLTSSGCITAEQTPMPWQPCERYLPVPAGTLFNPLPALPGPPPPSLPGPSAQAISLESRVTAAAPPPRRGVISEGKAGSSASKELEKLVLF